MNQARSGFNHMVENDPMQVDKMNRARVDANGSTKKQIYALVVAIPLLVVVAIIFFMIARIDGAIFGTPDDEMNSIIE